MSPGCFVKHVPSTLIPPDPGAPEALYQAKGWRRAPDFVPPRRGLFVLYRVGPPWCNRARTRVRSENERRARMRKLLLAVALLAVPALSAAAANDPWTGTWKLDPAKSHFTGDTFTYSKLANGLMHYSNGSTQGFDFGIDGKEYSAVY